MDRDQVIPEDPNVANRSLASVLSDEATMKLQHLTGRQEPGSREAPAEVPVLAQHALSGRGEVGLLMHEEVPHGGSGQFLGRDVQALRAVEKRRLLLWTRTTGMVTATLS